MVSVKIRQIALFLGQGLNHLLWPAVCLNCGVNICDEDRSLCHDCWGELITCSGGDYCRRCGKDASQYAIIGGRCPDCQGREIYFDRIGRGGVYAQSLRKMILAFKKSRTEFDLTLGFLGNCALEGSGFFDDIDIFVPVPLHWSRRLPRGYNQAHLLAKKLKHPTAKIDTDLVRIRRTRVQPAMVSMAGRARNVAGAFAVRRGHKLAGKKVCLIDDIKTSGATLNECARVLKEAGAVKVYALVLAVADQRVS